MARLFTTSATARRMAQTAAYRVDQVIPLTPVRQWVPPLPIPLRMLLAGQPKQATPVLPQVVHRVITRHLLGQAGLSADGVPEFVEVPAPTGAAELGQVAQARQTA